MRLIDRRQTVRYAAEDESLAIEKWQADLPSAATAGFRPAAPGRWDRNRARPTLVVDYEFDPPPTIHRTIRSDASTAGEDFARDATKMARAGYVPDSEQWRGTTYRPMAALVLGPEMAYGWSARGVLAVRYRFDPELAGEPVRAVAITQEDGATPWWVLRR